MQQAPRIFSAACWRVIQEAARLPIGGEGAWRVLVAQLQYTDIPEYHRSGKLISAPSIAEMMRATALNRATIALSRRRFRQLGLMTWLNPDRTGPDQPTMMEIHAPAVSRVYELPQKTTGSLGAAAAAAKRAKPMPRPIRPPMEPSQLTLVGLPEGAPLPAGSRRG